VAQNKKDLKESTSDSTLIKINEHHSYNLGELPKGCQQCVRGEKLVIFVTGICPRKCYFCPVSDEKWGKDVTFANERKILTTADILAEAEMMNAKGAGITGGDPLAKVDRCVRYIKELKKKFGQSFHIHLYTSQRLVSDSAFQKLYQAGLDEIRFHLDLDSQQFWHKLGMAQKFPWDLGVEVPLIPKKKKELIKLIDYIQGKVSFLNLNELEVSDNKMSKLLQMGYKTTGQFSYAVENSLELGQKLINYVQEKKYPLKVHVCTAKLKDATQLTNRIKRESEGAKYDFDAVDEEGLLTRGALYLEELMPGFDYRKKLDGVDKQELIAKLQPLFEQIKQECKLQDHEIFLDEEKPRILISRKNVRVHKDKLEELGLKPAIVKEYPTADQLEIEVTFI